MNSRFIKILFISLLISITSFGQKQGNIWYFGDHGGLDFNSGNPVVLQNSAMYNFEGVSSISDENGNLLMYTDGQYVYDRTHQVMMNGSGLGGNPSSTQSGVILPIPNDPDHYLIFSVDYAYSMGNLMYSLVDINQNAGLGAITQKNVLLESDCAEKISAVLHSNKHDIWVVVHQRYSNEFHSYLITNGGVSKSYVISNTGANINSGVQGYLKFSPDGTKLAMATYLENRVDFFGFNTGNGQVTFINSATFSDATYGVEFSPSGKYLYLSVSYNIKQIYQIEISTWSKTLVASPAMAPGALQLGPDGKIYVARYDRPNISSRYLGVINSPDQAGTSCDYVDEAVYLGSGGSLMGLPTFIQSYFDTEVTLLASDCCAGTPTGFSVTISNDILANLDWVEWNFGDPLNPNNTSDLLNPLHTFSEPGDYNIHFKLSFSGNLIEKTTSIVVWPLPETVLPDSVVLCPHKYTDISAGDNNYNYLWSNNQTTPSLITNEPGIFAVQKTSAFGCTSFDSVLVKVSFLPQLFLGEDFMLCNSESKMLSVTGFATFLWQDGTDDSTYSVTSPGVYSVTATNNDGCKAFDEIKVYDCCEFSLEVPNAFTPNGDGLNDTFKPLIYGVSKYQMIISNRWGGIIFSTNDTEAAWDGKFKNQNCPEGVYFVVLEYMKCDFWGVLTNEQYFGSVTLLRNNRIN